MAAKEFQLKGAGAQKDGVRRRVHKALARLREENKSIPADQRKEITQEDIEREAPVSYKTLEQDYHAPLLREILTFLAEINVGVEIASPKPPRPPRKSSVFKQNDDLMQRVEALRYRLRTELAEKERQLADKQRQLDAKDARIATLTDEISKLRRPSRPERPPSPKRSTRRSQVA